MNYVIYAEFFFWLGISFQIHTLGKPAFITLLKRNILIKC